MKVPVDECPAGFAMDAAVAMTRGWDIGHWRDVEDSQEYDSEWRWSPSIDIAAAWELVEEAAKSGWRLTLEAKLLHCREIRAYVAIFDRLDEDKTEEVSTIEAKTAPLAICRAFLKSHSIEYVEVPDESTC